jgi:hypothetical protein
MQQKCMFLFFVSGKNTKKLISPSGFLILPEFSPNRASSTSFLSAMCDWIVPQSEMVFLLTVTYSKTSKSKQLFPYNLNFTTSKCYVMLLLYRGEEETDGNFDGNPLSLAK